MKLELTRHLKDYLLDLVESDDVDDSDGLRAMQREALLIKLRAMPNYSLGVTYFDKQGKYRMPLKVDGGRVWFAAPVLENLGAGAKLVIASLLEREFEEWVEGARIVEYLAFGTEPLVWRGL